MVEIKEQSLIEIAEIVLKETKEPVDLYDLFDLVLDKKDMGKSFDNETLTDFYTDITSSAKFIYMGNNTWDLKRRQKIELWEKDGSFYREYREVSDEAMEKRIAEEDAKEKEHQAMLEARKKAAIEREEKAKLAAEKALEETTEEQVDELEEELVEDTIIFEEIEPEIPEKKAKSDKTEKTEDDTDTEYTEEEEEEYNKYMDMYEDEYDK